MEIKDINEQIECIANCVNQYQATTKAKVVVYTSLTNNHDTLSTSSHFSRQIDYICFTETKGATDTKGWKNFSIDFDYRDHRRLAKIFKVLPHRFLQGYEYSIYVDSNIDFKISVNELIIQARKTDNNIAFFKHNKRTCAYEEAIDCAKRGKERKEVIQKQMEKYKTEGFPTNYGLIQGGVIIRSHMEPDVIKLMEKWWEEIDKNSVRDQLSLNYCSWQTKIPVHYIQDKILQDFFELRSHKKYTIYEGSFEQNIRFLFSWLVYRISFIRVKLKKLLTDRKG